jgi:hypothetical protein
MSALERERFLGSQPRTNMRSKHMRNTMTSIAGIVAAAVVAASTGGAMAASASAGGGQAPPSVFTTLLDLLLGNSPLGPGHTTGQPNQSCGSPTAPNTPGNAANAPGSAFNPDGKAGTVYAGQQPQNSKNPVSVSQYDVACSHQPAP